MGKGKVCLHERFFKKSVTRFKKEVPLKKGNNNNRRSRFILSWGVRTYNIGSSTLCLDTDEKIIEIESFTKQSITKNGDIPLVCGVGPVRVEDGQRVIIHNSMKENKIF